MKTFQQFQENIIAKKLGQITLGQIAKGAAVVGGSWKEVVIKEFPPNCQEPFIPDFHD